MPHDPRPKIDLRITLDAPVTSEEYETSLVHNVLAETDGAISVVVLRNDGFGRIVPDEATRQEL